MNSSESARSQGSFFEQLSRELQELWQSFTFSLVSGQVALRNGMRRARGLELDYVAMPIGGPLPQRSEPPRSFIQRQLPLPPRPFSLQMLNDRLQVIRDAQNVKGVVFIFSGFSAGLATMQSFRSQVERVKLAGKEVVVYTPFLDLVHYFAATVADRIIAPPTARFEVLGLHTEVVFLRDALKTLGIEAEVIQISPYKDAYDMFVKSGVSPEQEEQVNWLLDEIYDTMVEQMAIARNMKPDKLRALIDSAPLLAEESVSSGLVDHLAYEDELPFLLSKGPQIRAKESAEESTEESAEESKGEGSVQRKGGNGAAGKAKITVWSEARAMFLEKARRPSTKYIGVVNIDGAIVMGPSRSSPIIPPVPIPILRSVSAGEQSIGQLLKSAERDNRMAALIVCINSPGGSPLASDLLWRHIARIAEKKPVVAFLGDVAASGGYYISTPAQAIVAQPLTMTGSIGVLTAHFNTAELFEKIGVNRVDFNRGERAALGSDLKPLSDEDRKVLWDHISDTYSQFKRVVSEGRDISYEDLEPICGGRVWMGSQALRHDLVDKLGDFEVAVQEAINLAELPVDDGTHIRVVNLRDPEGAFVLPATFEPAEVLMRLIADLDIDNIAGRPQYIMPFEIAFRKG